MKEYKNNALVGYTGFVGSNIYSSGIFSGAYNSKNIEKAFGTRPDLLIYAGLRAEKYLANNKPEKDMALILQAEENIAKIDPGKLVLISTIDVFKDPVDVDENSAITTDGLHAYGYNRLMLEKWVRDTYPEALIIRLPGLYGRNLKKNFIYDFINVIPFMLKEDKFSELTTREPSLAKYYELQDNGFYRANVPDQDKEQVKCLFRELGFSALSFTDSRSVYQFYNLSRLWDDIQIALDNDLHLLHMATEPVSAGELFRNKLPGNPAFYNYRTIHAGLFGGENGYIENITEVKNAIKEYAQCEQRKDYQ